jgi:hypothetical protein
MGLERKVSKEAYWDGLCGRNPALAKGGKVSLDVVKLRDIVFQAYSRGFDDASSAASNGDALFRELFGRRR